VAARRHRWLRWVLGIVGGLVVLVAIAAVLFFVFTRNPEVGAFYDPPDDVPADPGAILRSEPFDDGLPTGARGWKVLYASTDAEGRPLAVSGLIIASATPTPGPHPVLAWAHGTTGIARPCAPSLTDDPLDGIPDMTAPIDRGWVIVLTDYPGLGTPSPHPYLVGESEGRAVLDSVRAAHRFDIGIELDDTYAVWGHSQGGHAALFAGQLAADYLPDYDLAGVAALAPATTLAANLSAIQGTEAGNLLSIYAVESWQDYYPDIPPDSLTPDAKGPAGRIAELCLNQPSRFRILLNIPALPNNIMGIDPATNPIWKGHLDANSPSPTGIGGPVFVAQGLADEVVAPAVTTTWVTDRCTAGAPTVFHTYPDMTHDGVVGPGGADAYSWTIDRFEGTQPPDDCP
jgi:acetyl esterase/lipase